MTRRRRLVDHRLVDHRLVDRSLSDDGFTLTEMLIAGLLFAFIFLIAATIFISSLGVQQTVSDMSDATIEAQLAANSINRGVINARGLELTGDTGAPALIDTDDQMLVAKVATSDPEIVSFNCQAWYYDASESQIRWTTGTLAAGEMGAPSEVQLAGWTLLTSAVTEIADLVPLSVFTHTGASIEVAYHAAIEDNSPVEIHFTAASLAGAPETETLSECF